MNLFLLPADHPFSSIFLEQFTTFNDFSSIKTTRNLTRWVHTVDPFFFQNLWWSDPLRRSLHSLFFEKKSPTRFPSGSELNMSQAIHYCLRTSVPWVGKNRLVAMCFLTRSAFFQIGKYIKCWIVSICLKLVYQRVVCVCFFFCVGYCQSPPLNATWHTECQRYSACIFFQGNDELPRVYIFFGCMELTTFTACNVKCCVESARRCLSFCFGRCSQPNILARFSRVAILPLMETIRLQWSVIHENELISEKIFHQRSLLDRLADGH